MKLEEEEQGHLGREGVFDADICNLDISNNVPYVAVETQIC